jgi:RNA polymerase sigma-70 factor (ECF subfamily)
VLRFYDDLTVPEIANRLGLSDGAVKRYLSDGIHHLNTVLGTAAEVGGATSAPVYTSGRRPR